MHQNGSLVSCSVISILAAACVVLALKSATAAPNKESDVTIWTAGEILCRFSAPGWDNSLYHKTLVLQQDGNLVEYLELYYSDGPASKEALWASSTLQLGNTPGTSNSVLDIPSNITQCRLGTTGILELCDIDMNTIATLGDGSD